MKNTLKIYPEHCNPLPNKGSLMLHGGTILKEADRVAALEVEKILPDGMVGLTVGVDKCEFLAAASMGDTIEINTEIESVNIHRITVKVSIRLDDNDVLHGPEIFRGLFHFCSFVYHDNKYILAKHGLKGQI